MYKLLYSFFVKVRWIFVFFSFFFFFAFCNSVWERLEKENPEFYDNNYKGTQHLEHPTFTPTGNFSVLFHGHEKAHSNL